MLKATHNRNGYNNTIGKTKRHFIGEYSGNGVAELKSDLGKFDFNRLKDYIGLGMSGGGMEDGLIPPEYYTKFATQSNQHRQEGSGMSGCDSDTEGGSKKSQYLQHLLYKDQFDIQRPQEQYRPNLEKRDRYRREQPIAPMPMIEESIASAAQIQRPVDEPLVPSLSRARSLERIRARAASERPPLNETQYTAQQEYQFESKPEPSYVLKEHPRPPPSFKSETKTASEEAVSRPKKKTIESIQGISNMQPVLEFLDKKDAAQLARVSKGMNKVVEANKYVTGLPDIKFKSTLMELEPDVYEKWTFSKNSKKSVKNSDRVVRVYDAMPPYNLILLEPDSGGATIPISSNIQSFRNAAYPYYFEWDQDFNEDPYTLSPQDAFERIKENPDYKEADYDRFLKAIYKHYAKTKKPESETEAQDRKALVKEYGELLKKNKLKHKGYTSFTIADLRKNIKIMKQREDPHGVD